MAGASPKNPVGIGYKTVEAAVKALKGEKKLPKIIDTGTTGTTRRTSTIRNRCGSLRLIMAG